MADTELIAEVEELVYELDKRGKGFRRLEKFKGECPVPTVIRRARATNAYRMLMEFAQTNYGRLIIRAATSRMRVGGIRTGNEEWDKALWAVWHANHLDSDSRLGHDVALTHGRVFAIVWPNKDAPPSITLESPDTCIVKYRDGSRHDRVAGLRRWKDKDGTHATLYRADGVYKFTSNDSGKWERRIGAEDEGQWPLPVPEKAVRVVEIATNRELKDTPFGHAHGDFEGNTGLIERIMVLDFLRLVIAFTSGFPIRAVIGDELEYKKDADGNDVIVDGRRVTIAPFELAADVIAQFENPEVRIEQLQAGDLKGFGDAIDRDIEQLAGLTQTPSYFLRQVPIQNVSADAIRASDAALNGRVEEHQPNVADGWREVLTLAGRQLSKEIVVPTTAEVIWVDRQSRSLSERADAFTKLATGLPWEANAEFTLDADQETIARWQEMGLAEQLLAPPPPAKPEQPQP